MWGAPPPGLRWRLNDFADANLYGIYNKCAHEHTTLGFPRAHVWDLAVGPGSRHNFPICDTGPVAGAVGVRVRPPRAGASLSSGVFSGVCAVATGGSPARARAGASHTNSRGRLPYKKSTGGPTHWGPRGRLGYSGVTAGCALRPARAPRLQWVGSAVYALEDRLARASRPAGGILETVEESVSTDDGRREMDGG